MCTLTLEVKSWEARDFPQKFEACRYLYNILRFQNLPLEMYRRITTSVGLSSQSMPILWFAIRGDRASSRSSPSQVFCNSTHVLHSWSHAREGRSASHAMLVGIQSVFLSGLACRYLAAGLHIFEDCIYLRGLHNLGGL